MAPPTHAEMMPATRLDPDPAPGPPGLSVAELYDRHAAMVFRSLRALGVHEANLDDAVQDVFLVVHRRLADFEGRSAITTWLYGIAMNLVRNHLSRSPQRLYQWEDESALDDTASMP